MEQAQPSQVWSGGRTFAPHRVEVHSPSNTDAEMEFKTRLFLDAGAVEVWIVSESGGWQVFDADGLKPSTRYGVQLMPSAPTAT